MESILRAVAVYAVLFVLIRLAGQRTLSQMTSFDFVLLLVIGDATQQALLGDNFSFINSLLVVVTLLGIDIALSLWKRQSKHVDRLMDGLPLVVVDEGRPLKDRMHKARIDEEDVLAAARMLQGLERMDQIKYAVLERSGGISIVPAKGH